MSSKDKFVIKYSYSLDHRGKIVLATYSKTKEGV